MLSATVCRVGDGGLWLLLIRAGMLGRRPARRILRHSATRPCRGADSGSSRMCRVSWSGMMSPDPASAVRIRVCVGAGVAGAR
jgi:hypothetical protein